MAIYKTYKEAVLANGSTKGVYEKLRNGGFQFGFLEPGQWKECDPADHLESLEDFRDSDKKLMPGDIVTLKPGGVLTLSESLVEVWGTQSDGDDKRFVLQAAADQVETPEEKEAFDAIDTTPQQAESLSKNEWKNGDTLLWKNGNGEFLECNTGRYIGYDYEDDFHVFVMTDDGAAYRVGYAHSDGITRPETPAEREERERLESARELYLFANKAMQGADIVNHYNFEQSECIWLALVDKTGYRKQ